MERRTVFFFFFFFWFLSVVQSLSHLVSEIQTSTSTNSSTRNLIFTPKASLVRYWNKRIVSNHLAKPLFFLDKASPLSAVESAVLTKLAAQNALSSRLSAFCSSANLFCSFAESSGAHGDGDANFAFYSNKHFSAYGNSRLGGEDVFKNYSGGVNFAAGDFAGYGRNSAGHHGEFSSYAEDANVASSNFSSYAAGATGGSGDFSNYFRQVNVPDLHFTSYDSDGNDHKLSFSSYVGETNSGREVFTNYAKNGNGVPVDFSGYGDSSNVIGSAFAGYSLMGNAANDTFKAYSSDSNNPTNNFKSYGAGGNAGIDSFLSYRDGGNTGTDTFQSYGKNSNSEKTDFVNYGKSFNQGADTFKEYGKGSKNPSIGFKIYGLNSTFKSYTKKGVNFARYTNGSSGAESSGKSVNKWMEQGKFFRESILKEGTVTKMPDIRDKLPNRSFLPRSISAKLPFSTAQLSELKQIFHARDNSAAERMMLNALTECERAPSRDETKRCVGSGEDMIDFAVSVLGRNTTVRATENVNGTSQDVMIGKVKISNGGEITKSVSCHQSLYPYLLYYCHSVPKVRVYVADILDVGSKVKINRGIAICHLDTSAWSPGHGAFVALGSGPGLIEVCHWIFENDMIWTVAD